METTLHLIKTTHDEPPVSWAACQPASVQITYGPHLGQNPNPDNFNYFAKMWSKSRKCGKNVVQAYRMWSSLLQNVVKMWYKSLQGCWSGHLVLMLLSC